MPAPTSDQRSSARQRLHVIFYSVDYFDSKSFDINAPDEVISEWKKKFHHNKYCISDRIIDRYFMHLIVYEGMMGDAEADYWITFLRTDNLEVETSKGTGMAKARRMLRLCKRFCSKVK